MATMDWLFKIAGAVGLQREAAVGLASFGNVVPIAQARPGKRVRVRGVVRAVNGLTTESPSGRCVVAWWSELLAFRGATSENGSKIWESVRKAEGGVQFALQDDTGTLLVDPQGAFSLLVATKSDYTSSLEAIPAGVEELAAGVGLPFDGDLEFTESRVVVGEELEVVGFGKTRTTAEGYRGEQADVLVIDSTSVPAVFREVWSGGREQ